MHGAASSSFACCVDYASCQLTVAEIKFIWSKLRTGSVSEDEYSRSAWHSHCGSVQGEVQEAILHTLEYNHWSWKLPPISATITESNRRRLVSQFYMSSVTLRCNLTRIPVSSLRKENGTGGSSPYCIWSGEKFTVLLSIRGGVPEKKKKGMLNVGLEPTTGD